MRCRYPRCAQFGICEWGVVAWRIRISGVILGPVRARLGHLQHCCDKRIILWPHFVSNHFHFRPFGQLCLRRQHQHAIPDCAFVAHPCRDLRPKASWAMPRSSVPLPRFSRKGAKPAKTNLAPLGKSVVYDPEQWQPLRGVGFRIQIEDVRNLVLLGHAVAATHLLIQLAQFGDVALLILATRSGIPIRAVGVNLWG